MMRGVSESTRRHHLVMHRCLKEWGVIRHFEDLTTRNLKLWDDHIRTKVSAQTSVHGYHKRLKPYIFEAIQFGLIKQNRRKHEPTHLKELINSATKRTNTTIKLCC